MLTAWIYYRFSTKAQEKGSSKERQIEDCEALCQHNGWEIAEVFGDAGKSAWSGAHLNGGKLGGFTERVRSGEIGAGHVLVVEKLDRLSREEIVVARNWIEEMCSLGIQISTVQGHTLTKSNVQTDIMVMLEMLFRAKLAKDESDQKSERVSAAMKRNLDKAKEEGRILTRRCHGWLRVNKDRTVFEVIEDRAETVREIYQMAADGYGRLHIAKTLNSMGVKYRVWGKSKLAQQGKWNPTYIGIILRSPAVEGDYIKGFMNPARVKNAHSVHISGYYPRIVDADLVARARTSMDGRKLTGGQHKAKMTNLFTSGLAICGACGSRMHLGSTHRLQCMTAGQNRGCTQTQMFRYSALEKAVLDQILHLAMDDRFFRAPDQTRPLTIAAAELTKEAAELRSEKTVLLRKFAKSGDPDIEAMVDEVTESLTDVENRLKEAQEALRNAQGNVSPQEHVQRVSEVRALINAEDRQVREPARMRVHEALKSIKVKIVCRVAGDHRECLLTVMDRMAVYRIGNDGQILGELNVAKEIGDAYDRMSEVERKEVLAALLPANPASLDNIARFVERSLR